ncbi:MAG: hypothetical protein GY745_21450 [Actinomycetia bacterium]|nr:hypothetical protein [Actinomycetes bacterium]MCP3912847.1 hypothetical protein [Actinomycetes bacterium]MCP4087586.1 hypothetical protein [Actinomycetes bacterium]
MADSTDPTILRLDPWTGSWPDDDPNGGFKAEVAEYGHLDPLHTLEGMSASLDIPVGALARYVLAKWATAGSEGLLHLGSTTVERMWSTCEQADEADTDDARLAAYESLRSMISWLRLPLNEPAGY